MLFDRFRHLPNACHAVREDDEVAGFHSGRLARSPLACGRDEHLALEDICGLGAAILPCRTHAIHVGVSPKHVGIERRGSDPCR